jgi:TIR domain-containing protein
LPVQVFISYARFDDEPPPGLIQDQGFVTFLHRQLRWELQGLGGLQPKLWRDVKQIEPANQFDPAIENAIANSSILVFVLSRNSLYREYCLRELELFAQRWRASGEAAIKDRIVVVSKHYVPPEERPPLLQGQQGYDFFALEGEREAGTEYEFFYRGQIRDERYVDRVKALATFLWRFRDSGDSVQASATSSVPSRTVYLAKPALDMREHYIRLVSELQRRGYGVVPDPGQDIPLTGLAVDYVDSALAKSELSVHLLGDKPGYAPEDAAPITALQLARAAERANGSAGDGDTASHGFRRLIWAPKLLEGSSHAGAPEAERDPLAVLEKFDHQRASDKIEGASLSKFVDFLIEHLKRTAPPSKVAKDIKPNARVYLYHCPEDTDYVVRLYKALQQREVKPQLPAFEGDPTEVQAFHRKNLAECDAVVLCWAAASEVWARATAHELRDWRELGRSKEFVCRGLVAGPPPGARKNIFVELAPPDEIDVVVDLTGLEQPSPEALDPLVRRTQAGVE